MVVAAPLKIGEVAGRSGLTVKTIRFYCDEGLIHPISRSEGGYRLFGEEVFAELALIRTLKAMDSPLQLLEGDEEPLGQLHDLLSLREGIIELLLIKLDLLNVHTFFRTLTLRVEVVRGCCQFCSKPVGLLGFFV